MDMGERVLITSSTTGKQAWATVLNATTQTGVVETTEGGLFDDKPDIFRTFTPGRSVTTVTLELDESW